MPSRLRQNAKSFPRQITGGAVDETLNSKALAVLKAENLDSVEARDVLGKLLGEFRLFRSARDTEPQAAQTADHLQSISRSSDKLMKDMDAIPMGTEAEIAELMHSNLEKNYFTFKDQLRELLTTLSAVSMVSGGIIRKSQSRTGKKNKNLEAILLSDTTREIQLLQGIDPDILSTDAAKVARNFLVAAGVEYLPDAARARRSVLSIREKLQSARTRAKSEELTPST